MEEQIVDRLTQPRFYANNTNRHWRNQAQALRNCHHEGSHSETNCYVKPFYQRTMNHRDTKVCEPKIFRSTSKDSTNSHAQTLLLNLVSSTQSCYDKGATILYSSLQHLPHFYIHICHTCGPIYVYVRPVIILKLRNVTYRVHSCFSYGSEDKHGLIRLPSLNDWLRNCIRDWIPLYQANGLTF